MTGYEKMLARCNDEEKTDINNAIKSANKPSYTISYYDNVNRKKITVSRPPFSEKWTAVISDYLKKSTKIITEDTVNGMNYVSTKIKKTTN